MFEMMVRRFLDPPAPLGGPHRDLEARGRFTDGRECRKCRTFYPAVTAKWDFFQADLRPQEWMSQAACKDHPNPELWFPDVGNGGDEARAICADCPVREACAEYGKSEQWGIWGGLSYKEKKPLRQGAVAVSGEMCRKGHMMTPENTVFVNNGSGRRYRYCRKCRSATAARHYRKAVGYH